MKRNKGLTYGNILFICVLLLALLVVCNVSFEKIFSLPNNIYVSYEEIEKSNKNNDFGQLVRLSMDENEISTAQGKVIEGEVVFKLFGIFPIKKVTVNILPDEEVYLGGCPIGLALHSDGAVVVSNTVVLTESSKIIKNSNFKNGDIITEINGQEVHSIEDISNLIQSSESDSATITYKSDNQEKTKEIALIKDDQGQFRIGLWVKDNFSGVGTLTFVKEQAGELYFGALGHPITNGQNENVIPITNGEIYNCSLVDIAKGEKNVPGELRCVFVQKNQQGSFDKNTSVGIFGVLENESSLIDQNRRAPLAGRLSAKPGDAKILSSVSGIMEEYDIEIIKTTYQTKSADKSLVFRVKDKRLLDLTGGIVQGMSGSPIIQDGKIIGAVTHVFVSDPTKGFGVYSDWMLEQIG